MRYNINKSVWQLLKVATLCAATLMSGCYKDFEMELPLAVNQDQLSFTADGGSTHIMIYATEKWSAALSSDWAEIDRTSGSGNGELIFTYQPNPTIARRSEITIESNGLAKVITTIQKGLLSEAIMTPARSKVSTIQAGANVAMGFATNMTPDMKRIEVTSDFGDTDNKWIDNIEVKEDSVKFTVAPNTTGEDRKAKITLSVVNGLNNDLFSSTIDITQTTESGYMTIEEQSVKVEPYARTNSVKFATNLTAVLKDIQAKITYNGGSPDWIKNVTPKDESLDFDVDENTGEERSATIQLSYTDNAGVTCTASIAVTQGRPARSLTFEQLRDMIPGATGSINLEEDYIVGLIISDKGNLNMETNPNITYKSIDFDVNERTAYIQDLEAKYGFRLQTTRALYNTFVRNSKLTLSLSGLTLTKESDPVRYTLSGITDESVLGATSGDASNAIRKEKFMSELTDDDIYTFVTLKETEIAYSSGAYTNCHDGYLVKTSLNTAGRTEPVGDCVPLALRDSKGSQIKMLFNSKTPWRKTGISIPRGSGSVSGVVVHSTLSRYGRGGDIGRYQIRALEESDIAISQDKSSSFSATIAEWDWHPSTNGLVKDADNKVRPHTGSGYIYSSVPTTAALTPGFSHWTYGANVSNGALRYNAKWWNFSTNSGEWFSINFSTQGISSSNLALIMTIGGGNQAASSVFNPLNWNVDYSTDGGGSFTRLQTIAVHPIIINALQNEYASLGLTEFVINLPNTLFNKDNVTIRIQAADTVCGSANGTEDDSILTASNIQTLYMRMGYVAIRYNK